MMVQVFFLFLVFQNVQIHRNPISLECVTSDHGLEVNPFRMCERVLDLVFEDDVVEFVKEGTDLFIHNDQFL